MKFIFIILSFGLSLSAWSRTVCSVTINSSNEIDTFQRKLKKSDPGLQFVELTEKGDQQNWLQKACESGVQCDSLVISGHYAWAFMSEQTNGFQVSSEELQGASCSRKCQGIFNQPKEVYLFGCNTLSTAKPDHRTPAQYRKVLIDSKFPPDLADMVVACRYKNIGCSSLEKMKKIFTGVPLIYGFDSTSPLGAVGEASVARLLDKAIQRDGSYSQRLSNIEAARTMEMVSEMNRRLSNYRADWTTSFGGSSTSCSGYGTQADNECILSHPNRSLSEKLVAVEKLMESPQRKDSMLSIQKFLTEVDATQLSETDKEILVRISKNTAAQSDFMSVYNQVSSVPYLKIRYSNMGRRLAWISPEQNRADIRDYISPYLSDGRINRADSDVISRVGPMNAVYEDQPALLNGSEGIRLVGLTRTNDVGFKAPLVDIIENSSSTRAEKNDALRSLAQIRPRDKSNLAAYEKILSGSNSDDVEAALNYVHLLPPNDNINDKVFELATKPNNSYACSALRRMLNSGSNTSADVRTQYNKHCQ